MQYELKEYADGHHKVYWQLIDTKQPFPAIATFNYYQPAIDCCNNMNDPDVKVHKSDINYLIKIIESLAKTQKTETIAVKNAISMLKNYKEG